MKRVIVICDGMADFSIATLHGKTPFEAASTPSMDKIALHGKQGMIQTVPEGFYPGSETAILSILGYRPEELPKGRGPLEARGLDIPLLPGQYAGRYLFNKSRRAFQSGISLAPSAQNAGLWLGCKKWQYSCTTT